MKFVKACTCLSLVALFAGACTSAQELGQRPASDSDAGAKDSGGSKDNDGSASSSAPQMCSYPVGVGCNELLFGDVVTSACGPGTAPKGSGGTIVEGTYVLTAFTNYLSNSPGPCQNQYEHRGAVSYHAGVLNRAMDGDPHCTDGPSIVDSKHRQTWSVSPDSSDLCGNATCDTFPGWTPSSTRNCWSYTATGNTLVLTSGQYQSATYTLVP